MLAGKDNLSTHVIVPNVKSCSDVLSEVRSIVHNKPQCIFERLHLPFEVGVVLFFYDGGLDSCDRNDINFVVVRVVFP